MASHGYGQAADNTNALKAEIKTLTVERLKNVLRHENLTVSGVKSELQIRLISRKAHQISSYIHYSKTALTTFQMSKRSRPQEIVRSSTSSDHSSGAIIILHTTAHLKRLSLLHRHSSSTHPTSSRPYKAIRTTCLTGLSMDPPSLGLPTRPSTRSKGRCQMSLSAEVGISEFIRSKLTHYSKRNDTRHRSNHLTATYGCCSAIDER